VICANSPGPEIADEIAPLIHSAYRPQFNK
jgi:hypothetical protein